MLGFSVKQIESGNEFNCALGESGQVKCWGGNDYGQLGYGHTNSLGDSPEESLFRLPFVQVGSRVKKLSLGTNHVCALLVGGDVKCWGHNDHGELGLGHREAVGDDETPSSVGVVSLGQAAVDIVVGWRHSCALLADKSIKCWGYNHFGQLGLGNRSNIGDDELPSSVPVLNFVEDVEQVFAGQARTCALFENMGVKCWGAANRGLLGYPSPHSGVLDISQARFIDFGVPVDQLALGHSHTCAALVTGEVRCFGSNSYGQLGLGHLRRIGDNESLSEENSSSFSDTRRVVTANFSYSASETNPQVLIFNSHPSFARNSIRNRVWNFGDGSMSTDDKPTHRFTGLGPFHVTLTVTDSFGQTATASRRIEIERGNASPYFHGDQVLTLEKSKKHIFHLSSALDLDSSALTYSIVQAPAQGTISGCLGGTNDLSCSYQAPSDFTGEVEFTYRASDGVSESLAVKVILSIVEPSPSILQIASGWRHSCALYENQRVKCWGSNSRGQLGLGHTNTIGDDEKPFSIGFVDVGGPVEQVSIGYGHTCVLLADRSAKCWGGNLYGELGLGHRHDIGDNELSSSISSLNLGEPLRQIVAGTNFTCALTDSGKVKCWGGNNSGQLGLAHGDRVGDEADETSDTFSAIRLGSRAMKISLGASHVCALLKEGRVRCWGSNEQGQLGYGHTHSIGDNEHPFLPGNVPIGARVLDVVAGKSSYTCALLEDRGVKCWGYRNYIGPGHSQNIGDNEWPSSIGSMDLGGAVRSIRLGEDFVCAWMAGGGLKCWGGNYFGQLGLGHNSRHSGWVDIPIAGEDILDFTLGGRYIYVLMEDGRVRSWGANDSGQLGLGHRETIGDNESIALPPDVSVGGVGAPLIARFAYNSYVRASNEVSFDASASYSSAPISRYSWNFGDGSSQSSGQIVSHTFQGSGSYRVILTITDSLGQTDTFSEQVRVKMPNSPPFFTHPREFFAVHQGETASLELMPAKDNDQNTNLTYTLVNAPSRGTLSNCLQGSADLVCDYLPDSSSMENVQFTYKANDGSLDSWEFFTVFLDIKVPRSPMIQISAGDQHVCVLFQNKKVSCWGYNGHGQLGLGHTTSLGSNEFPLFRDFVHMGDQESVGLGEGAVQISSGSRHTCALFESGKVRCWGQNNWGQLGLGHYQHIGDDELPSSVPALHFGQKVIQVNASESYTCVLLEGGGVRCWGGSQGGRLGLGHNRNINDISELTDLPLGQKAKFISAGVGHVCAVLLDGRVKCWGENSQGQLGLGHRRTIGDNESLSALESVDLSERVLRVFTHGSRNTCALFESLGLNCWGAHLLMVEVGG